MVYLACIIWPLPQLSFSASYTLSSFPPVSTSKPLLHAALYVGYPLPHTHTHTYTHSLAPDVLSMVLRLRSGGEERSTYKKQHIQMSSRGYHCLISAKNGPCTATSAKVDSPLPMCYFLSAPRVSVSANFPSWCFMYSRTYLLRRKARSKASHLSRKARKQSWRNPQCQPKVWHRVRESHRFIQSLQHKTHKGLPRFIIAKVS